MELAINVQGQEGMTWPDWIALAAACEEHGIATLSRSDHYEGFSPRAADGALDAWGTICGLAAVTTKLRLTTLVSPVTFRHPAVLAKLVATADRISDGRVEVGVGAGWAEGEHTTYGFAFPPMGERMRMLEHQLATFREQWTSGVHLPPPVQARVILGGSGGKRSLALAARYADEYNIGNVTPEEAGAVRQRLDERVRLSVMLGVLVAEDRAAVEARASAMREATGGRAPGPTAVLGAPEEGVARLREYAAHGVTRVFLGHGDHRDLETVRLIGREIAPRL